MKLYSNDWEFLPDYSYPVSQSHSMDRLILIFIIVSIVILVGSVIIYNIEAPHENSKIDSYLDAMWWTVATITTVGYGDAIPVTDAGKIMAIFYMLFAIGVLSVLLTVVGTRFYNRRIAPFDHEPSYSQKVILDRLEKLEKSLKEINENLKQNNR